MKALTVQQPWAWAIIHGGKDVENRTQVWSHRGRLMRLSERGCMAIPELLDGDRALMDAYCKAELGYGADRDLLEEIERCAGTPRARAEA